MQFHNNSKRSRLAPLATSAVLALVSLSGCAAVDQLAHKQISTEFASASDMPEQWFDRAPWLPTDAKDIRVMESTVNEDAASIIVTSASELDPDLCTEVARLSAPTMEVPDAPDVYAEKRALACGDWSVIRSDAGWYGWTPNSADERTATE